MDGDGDEQVGDDNEEKAPKSRAIWYQKGADYWGNVEVSMLFFHVARLPNHHSSILCSWHD